MYKYISMDQVGRLLIGATTLLGAKGIATGSKDATRSKGHLSLSLSSFLSNFPLSFLFLVQTRRALYCAVLKQSLLVAITNRLEVIASRWEAITT